MTHEQIAERIAGFVRHQLATGGDADPDRSAPLVTAGLLDSLAVAELLVLIQETTGTWVPDAALHSEGFDSIEGIARIVAQLGEVGSARQTDRPTSPRFSEEGAQS